MSEHVITPEVASCLGPIIRKRRLAAALTQRQLGVRVGSPRSIVCRAESSLHTLSIDTLERYARALDCKLSELILEAEAMAHGDAPALPCEVAL